MVLAMKATLAAQGLRVDPNGNAPVGHPIGVPPTHPIEVPPVNAAGVPPEHPAIEAQDPPVGVPAGHPVGVGTPMPPQDRGKGKANDNPALKQKRARQDPKGHQGPQHAGKGDGPGARGHRQAVSAH